MSFWRRRRDVPEEPDARSATAEAAHTEVEPQPGAPEPEPETRPTDALGAPPSIGLDVGLAPTRQGFMSRLRGFLGADNVDGPSWEDVEETLIAGDVGATL